MTKKKTKTKEKHSDSELEVEKKLDIKEDVWDDGPCLTASETAKLDSNTHQISILRFQLKINQLESENFKLTSQLINQKGLLKDRDSADLSRSYKEKLVSCRAFNDELISKYDLKENWGFNPLTGEIDQTPQKTEN